MIVPIYHLLRDAVRRDNCFRTERRYYAHRNILLRTSRASTGKLAAESSEKLSVSDAFRGRSRCILCI